jgi:hypothetical protein
MANSIKDKLSRLSHSNAFWTGGIGVALTGFGFEWAKAPTIVPAVLILAGWIFIIIAIYQHDFFEGKSKRLQVMGNLLISGIVTAIFVAAWLALRPEPSTVIQANEGVNFPSKWSSLTEGVARCVAYIGALPWRWILPSFIIGALAVWTLAFIREKRRRNLLCPERQLHQLKADDKERIRELVRIIGILYQPEFGKGSPYIDFTFSVFNISLHDIIIDNFINKGCIQFGEDWEKFYYNPKIESDDLISCKSRGSCFFRVRQAVTAEEITRFREADNLLVSFSNLEIRFRGTEWPLTVPAGIPLDTKYHVETKKICWRAQDHLAFVFGFSNEQWALITSTNPLSKSETEVVKREQDSLRSEIDKEQLRIEMLQPAARNVTINGVSRNALAVPFRNNSQGGDAIAKGLIAHIRFEYIDEKKNFNVNYGYWIEETGNSATIRKGETKHIVLVAVTHGTYVYDDKFTDRYGARCRDESTLLPGEYLAQIELVGDNFHQIYPVISVQVTLKNGVTWKASPERSVTDWSAVIPPDSSNDEGHEK